MKHFWITGILLLAGLNSFSQSVLTFGTDSTFELMTWNLENFPKNGQTTIEQVSQLIWDIDVDVIAVQEVSNINAFDDMVNYLQGYEGYLESDWFGGLAYIYKTSVVQINDMYEIYTASPYWSAFPRAPMVMDFNFKNERIIVINNHFKCCGDGYLNMNDEDDEEYRRYQASKLLKQYIDNNWPDENVIVTGDLNDDIAEPNINNVFQLIISEPENYRFSDMEIANGPATDWSYPTWPSHLDHILITNELFDNLARPESAVSTILIDDVMPGGWDQYEEEISDHRPVALRLGFNASMGVHDPAFETLKLAAYPNPANGFTTFQLPNEKTERVIRIYDLQGDKVCELAAPTGANNIEWNCTAFPRGVYLARLVTENQTATIRLVLQ